MARRTPPSALAHLPRVRALTTAAALALGTGPARAEPAPLIVDAGLVIAHPAALPTGLSTGFGAGVSRGDLLAFGVRASLSSVTEYALTTTVSQDDLRLRVFGALQRAEGRGTVGLRLAVGATAIHETRTRDQGGRAGLTGDALEATAWSLAPAADLELVVVLRLAGAWGVSVSGGPSVDVSGGALRAGWVAALGATWQP